jgi:hypothetical protein
MSEDTRAVGAIRIDPPLTWPEIEGAPLNIHRNFDRDAVLRVVEDEVNTSEGPLLRRTADAIIPERQLSNHHHLTEDIQELVTRYCAGRALDGSIDCTWAGGEDKWRIVVRDGVVARVRPECPVGARDEDGAA